MHPNTTMGEKYRPAMEMTEQSEADAYFEECVAHTMSFGKTRAEAESVERQNLGYFAGYYNDEARQRVERLFHCSHPIFGAIEQFGPMTADAALRSGIERGQNAKRSD